MHARGGTAGKAPRTFSPKFSQKYFHRIQTNPAVGFAFRTILDPTTSEGVESASQIAFAEPAHEWSKDPLQIKPHVNNHAKTH